MGSGRAVMQLKNAHEPLQRINSAFLPRAFAFYSPLQALHLHWFAAGLSMQLDMFTEVARYSFTSGADAYDPGTRVPKQSGGLPGSGRGERN